MTLSEFIAAAYLKATGEVSTLTSSDDDWEKLRQIGNIFIDEWAREPGVDWRSLYSYVSLADTVSATDTYALGTTLKKVSNQEDDYVRIVHTDGTYSDYQLVSPERLKYFSTGSYCAIMGTNLVFNAAFTASDPQFGGTIKVPGYIAATHMTSDPDTVPVDDPNWLVLMSAAEYVRNDITRSQQYPNLVAEANNLMSAMKIANNPQNQEVARSQAVFPNGATW